MQMRQCESEESNLFGSHPASLEPADLQSVAGKLSQKQIGASRCAK
jgi:hypothetical protein